MSLEPSNLMPDPKFNLRAESEGAVRFPPPLIYAAVMLLASVLDRFWRLPIPLPERLSSALGWAIGLLGLALAAAALSRFRATGQSPEPWKPTPEIITQGVYRWTRNPMYLGLLLVQGWIGLGVDRAWILIALPITMWAVSRWVIQPEEDYLCRKFGQPYLDYTQSVRRWL